MSVPGLLEGKIVIIAGSASGVGKAAAGLFKRHGATIVACDIDQAGLDALAAELPGISTFTCDVAVESEVAALIAFTVKQHGRLDVIYNNVGIGSPTDAEGRTLPLDLCDDGHLDRLVKVNVGGIFHGCKQAILQFKAQGGGGVIVNTASVAGLIGWGGVLYGGTKGSVVAMTRTLAIEVASQGIRVNSVCPAGMITNFGRSEKLTEITPEMTALYAKMHPLGRPIDPLECANAALFLASDLAANITGVNLPVDGGLSAQ